MLICVGFNDLILLNVIFMNIFFKVFRGFNEILGGELLVL